MRDFLSLFLSAILLMTTMAGCVTAQEYTDRFDVEIKCKSFHNVALLAKDATEKAHQMHRFETCREHSAQKIADQVNGCIAYMVFMMPFTFGITLLLIPACYAAGRE